MKRRTVITMGLMALAMLLAALCIYALRQVECGACGAACARRDAVKMPESAGGLTVETLFGRASAGPNAYVCQRCIDGLEDRVIAEMKKRQDESAQPKPGRYR